MVELRVKWWLTMGNGIGGRGKSNQLKWNRRGYVVKLERLVM